MPNQSPHHDFQVSATPRRVVLVGSLLLFGSALPDAMVVPVLKQLLVDRYGVGPSAAHLFMSVNILGAFLGASAILRMTRRASVTTSLCVAACLNAMLLALMALPIGFVATLVVRTFEGAADITVYALLFNLLSHAGTDETRGRRMGIAASSMMLGIASGIFFGGIIGAERATTTLWAGSLVCVVVALCTWVVLRSRVRGTRSAMMELPKGGGDHRSGDCGPRW